jgi:hypothetical protein
VKRIVTPKYVEHMTMNVYVKDSQISADLSTLSATGKAQKGKKFFVDLLMHLAVVLEVMSSLNSHQVCNIIQMSCKGWVRESVSSPEHRASSAAWVGGTCSMNLTQSEITFWQV